MGAVERAGRADRQADAVQRKRIKLADRVEAAVRRAAAAHVVFRVDFEKPKLRARIDDRLEMLGLEPDADARRGKALGGRRSATVMGFLQGLVAAMGLALATSLARLGHVTSAVHSRFEQNISPDL